MLRHFDSYNFVTKFKRFFGEQYAPFCYTYIAESETANENKGALVMKNRKTIFQRIVK